MGATCCRAVAGVGGRLAGWFEQRPSGAVVRRGMCRIGRRGLEPAAQLAALLLVAGTLLWPASVERALLPAAFPRGDLLLSHWPSALLIKERVAQTGRPPLWNPHYGGGRPLAADPLAALFYPPTHLVHLLAPRDHFLALQLGHLVWAGLGMVLLARLALRLPPLAALVAAVAFMGTPRLIAHLGQGHLTMTQTAAWFPWVALACWTTVRRPWHRAPALALCLALMVLAGHPQLAYYGGLLVGGQAVWLVAARGRAAGPRAALAAAVGLGLAGVLAGLLAAAHLAPLREFTAHSTRQHAVRSPDAATPAGFLRALTGDPGPSPYPHEALFEPGLAVLALAALGLALRPRAALPLLLGVALVAWLSLGVTSSLDRLAVAVLPGFDRFRALFRVWHIALPPIGLLAGLGLAALMRGVRRVSSAASALVGAGGVLLVALNLLATAHGFTDIGEVAPLTVPSGLARAAAEAAGGARVYGVQHNIAQLDAVALGLELADGQDPLLIEPYASFMQRAGGYTFAGYQEAVPPVEARDAQPDAGLLGLLDVGVVLSAHPLADPRLTRIGLVDDTFLYRNEANAGRAYLVAPGPDGGAPPLDSLRRRDASVRVERRGAEELRVVFEAPEDGYLVVGSPAFPGWAARLDGRPSRVETIYGVLPTIRVPAGAHELRYAYEPRSVCLGLALSLTGALLGLAWLGVGLVCDPRRGRKVTFAILSAGRRRCELRCGARWQVPGTGGTEREQGGRRR